MRTAGVVDLVLGIPVAAVGLFTLLRPATMEPPLAKLLSWVRLPWPSRSSVLARGWVWLVVGALFIVFGVLTLR